MSSMARRCLTCALPALVPICVAAQTLGIPLSYRPVMSGFGGAVDAGGDKGGFRTVAITGTLALGHVTAEAARMPLFNLSGTVAHLSGEGGASGGSDVGAELSLLGSFAVGIDRSRWAGVARTYVPLAAALPLVGCADARRILFIYGVPLWSFERVDEPTGDRWQRSWGSVNLGALFELRSGLGFQVAVGGLFQHTTPDPYRRIIVGAGVHFSPSSILKTSATGTDQGHRGCGFGL